MGIFGDKLLLKLNVASTSNNKPKFYIEKQDHKSSHLFPFSCVSLIGSQLTVLSSYHPRLLSKKVLEFVENPNIQYEATRFITGFQLEIFGGGNHIFYNQFSPALGKSLSKVNNDSVESDVIDVLVNYLIAVFEDSSSNDKSCLRIFLLMTISFYQQELLPFIKNVNIYDVESRKRIAKTSLDFSSALYRNWESTKTILPGNSLFMEKFAESNSFDSYLA